MPGPLTGKTRFVEPPRARRHPGEEATGQAWLDGALGGARGRASPPDAADVVEVPSLALIGRESPIDPVETAEGRADPAPEGRLAGSPGASHSASSSAPRLSFRRSATP